MLRVSAPPSSELPPPTVLLLPRGGARIGPYRLCCEIASGGMATVHLARSDMALGVHRFVALKRMHPHLADDPVYVEMFQDEARIASQVHHANVCSVLDFGVADGTYYLAMEYLAGESLATVRRAMMGSPTPLQPNRLAALACRLIADAAEGIHSAHEQRDSSGVRLDIVHRDISPDNLFLTYDGVVKIVDFGVARATPQKHQTRSGQLKGKYAYISPEVLCGGSPDRAADIWGLGVILWELLTLERLFKRSTELEVLRAVLNDRIRAPSEVRRGLDEGLDAIVLRALSRDPTARYQTARELARDLTGFLAEKRLAVGLAELSEHMEALFPDGRAQKLELLQIAERFTPQPVLELDPVEPPCKPTLSSARPPKRQGVFGTLRAHPHSAILATLFVTALAGVAVGRSSVAEAEARAATAPLAPPPAAPEQPAPAAPTALATATGDGDTVLKPVRLGTDDCVVEIRVSAGLGSRAVALRVNGQGSTQRASAEPRRVAAAPRSETTPPQPLDLGPSSD